MKLIIIFLLICNVCIGQMPNHKMDSLMKMMRDSGWSTMAVGDDRFTGVIDADSLPVTIGYLLRLPEKIKKDSSFEQYQEFRIMDSAEVEIFHYSTMDSILFVKDSLRTIKWLISLVIEDMKKYDGYSSWQELSLNDTGRIENLYDMDDGGDGVHISNNPPSDIILRGYPVFPIECPKYQYELPKIKHKKKETQMKEKRSMRYRLLVAYIRTPKNPTRMDIFATNYLRSRYIWAFCKE